MDVTADNLLVSLSSPETLVLIYYLSLYIAMSVQTDMGWLMVHVSCYGVMAW